VANQYRGAMEFTREIDEGFSELAGRHLFEMAE
jgi:hypothetical protein